MADKKYTLTIAKDGKYYPVDILNTRGNQGGGGKASNPNFTIKSMKFFIDTTNIDSDVYNSGNLDQDKKDMTKDYFRNDTNFDYDSSNFYKLASNYYLQIISNELDPVFLDAIDTGTAVLRFDYPTLNYNNKGTNYNYNGPGRVGYCREFNEDLKYKDILENMLISITIEDVKVDEAGIAYIDKKISLLDLIRNCTEYHLVDLTDPNRVIACSLKQLNITDIVDLPKDTSQWLADISGIADGPDMDGEQHQYYFNEGTTYGTYCPDGTELRAQASMAQASTFLSSQAWTCMARYVKPSAPYLVTFPIKYLLSNEEVINIHESNYYFGISSPFDRKKRSDHRIFNNSFAMVNSEGFYKHMVGWGGYGRGNKDLILVPQFGILTEDGSSWQKTYLRSKNTLKIRIPILYTLKEDKLGNGLAFSNVKAKIIIRN